jgi:hypothetical protein
MVEGTEAGVDPSWAARATAAEAASDARQWRRAAELWDALRTDFPHQARCWLKAGEAFCEARLLDEAERVLAEAVILFADDQWTGYQHTIVARRRGDWAEAGQKLCAAAKTFAPRGRISGRPGSSPPTRLQLWDASAKRKSGTGWRSNAFPVFSGPITASRGLPPSGPIGQARSASGRNCWPASQTNRRRSMRCRPPSAAPSVTRRSCRRCRRAVS